MNLGAPSPEQMEKINKFSKNTLEENQVYVFKDLMIDDLETDYHFEIHPNLLKKFMLDTLKGIPLMANHNSHQLPIGRSFDATLVQEYDEESGRFINTLYGDFYIDLGRALESGITTDDIVKGIEAGVINDTSIGFSAKKWVCNLCGNDVRTWECPHIPGRNYIIEKDGQEQIVKCKSIVGEDGEGELVENSLVYAGGAPRASIVNMDKGVINLENGSKLRLINDLKKVSLDATIYQIRTLQGVLMFCSEDEYSTQDYKEKRSEEAVGFYKEVLGKFGITAETPEELTTALEKLVVKEDNSQEDVGALKAELAAKDSELENIKTELTAKEAEVIELNTQRTELEQKVEELTAQNTELLGKAELVDTYRKDLIQQVLETGVRAYGNGFNTELFTKFTANLSVDELKEVLNGLNQVVETNFEGVRVTQESANKKQKEALSKEDFETEAEFRSYVAEQALLYAKENDVSIVEATKLMYKKFSNEDGSEN